MVRRLIPQSFAVFSLGPTQMAHFFVASLRRFRTVPLVQFGRLLARASNYAHFLRSC